MIRLGIIGLSEGNGHPFSFSAIINGYDPVAFAEAGWPVILDYLERQPREEIGLADARVTHAWTQDAKITRQLCAACKICIAADTPDSMLGAVDALIVARDDWPVHASLAMPYLRAGIPVFVDKPLSLDPAELADFKTYLESGLLMSTSGMRYARELDGMRDDPGQLGRLRLVSATVLNGLERYGIHMLDAVAGLGLGPVARITRLHAPFESFALQLADGLPVSVNCLGAVAKTFHLSLFGEREHLHVDLHDNFTAFRRTLIQFLKMVLSRRCAIDPKQTLATMTLIASASRLAPGESMQLP